VGGRTHPVLEVGFSAALSFFHWANCSARESPEKNEGETSQTKSSVQVERGQPMNGLVGIPPLFSLSNREPDMSAPEVSLLRVIFFTQVSRMVAVGGNQTRVTKEDG